MKCSTVGFLPSGNSCSCFALAAGSRGFTTAFPTGCACRLTTDPPTPQGRGRLRGQPWKRPWKTPLPGTGGKEPGSGFPPPLEDPAGLQLGSAPTLRSCLSERIFFVFSRRGLTFAGAKPIIMGSVQIFGGQSKAGETGLCQPSWSSDESPSVALSAIRRRLCCCRSARHRSSGRRRSGTLCVLRLASCLSWVLSAQLTTLQL